MGCLCLIVAEESLLFEKVSIQLARQYRPPSGHPLPLHLLGDSLSQLFSAASLPPTCLGRGFHCSGIGHMVIGIGIP